MGTESDGTGEPPRSPEAVEGKFSTLQPNANVLIYDGPVTSLIGAARFEQGGQAVLAWLPEPHVELVLRDTRLLMLEPGDTPAIIIPGALQDHHLLVTKVVENSQQVASFGISGYIDGQVQRGNNLDLPQIIFHVTNFTDYFGEWVQQGTGRSARRLRLDGGGWTVVVDAVQERHDLKHKVAEQAGYAFTHVGRIQRPDGAAFDADDGLAILWLVQSFLSFVRGRWVACALPTGSTASGETWEQWRVDRADPWRAVATWFDRKHPEELTDLFGRFTGKVNDPTWGKPLLLALGWYIESTKASAGIEAAILFVQAALELLAWITFVEDGSVTAEGFDRLPASDRLRLLLREAKIDQGIPPELSALAALAKSKSNKKEWEDGPHALTEIRNAITHPRKRTIAFDSAPEARLEAWRLGLHYLSLCLLHAFGHDGHYVNRTKRLERGVVVERVPWAQTSSEDSADGRD